jgi:hypothetical protein
MKKLSLLLFGCVVLWAQTTQTSVYKTMWTNRTTSNTFTAIPNIGATSHQVMFNQTDNTCIGTLTMSGSNDNVLFVSFAATIINGIQAIEIRGSGLYPYVHVDFTISTGTCTYSGWYTGSKTPLDPYLVTGQVEYTKDALDRLPIPLSNAYHDVQVKDTGATSYYYISTNGTSVQIVPTTAGQIRYIESIIVGTAGSGSALVLKDGLAQTIATIDTTTARVINLNLSFPVNGPLPLTYTTTGSTPALITILWR